MYIHIYIYIHTCIYIYHMICVNTYIYTYIHHIHMHRLLYSVRAQIYLLALAQEHPGFRASKSTIHPSETKQDDYLL